MSDRSEFLNALHRLHKFSWDISSAIQDTDAEVEYNKLLAIFDTLTAERDGLREENAGNIRLAAGYISRLGAALIERDAAVEERDKARLAAEIFCKDAERAESHPLRGVDVEDVRDVAGYVVHVDDDSGTPLFEEHIEAARRILAALDKPAPAGTCERCGGTKFTKGYDVNGCLTTPDDGQRKPTMEECHEAIHEFEAVVAANRQEDRWYMQLARNELIALFKRCGVVETP